jgi:cob(I)alamin adenosyltransferase
VKAERGWKRPFDEPIPLPRGRQLVTLEDAGNYITKLPKAVHEAKEWQAAMEALILVVTFGGPTMFARIGVMRALNRHAERVFEPSRKDKHWGKRKLKRDL